MSLVLNNRAQVNKTMIKYNMVPDFNLLRPHIFVDIDHEIICTLIFPALWFKKGHR